MKELSVGQIMAAVNLIKNPLISKVWIEVCHNGLPRITIISALDAEWDGPCGVDSLLVKELDKEFPGLEYSFTLKPIIERNVLDDTDEEFYFLSLDGETIVYLVIKKTPVTAGAEKKVPQDNSITKNWSAEQILRNEG